MMENLLSILLVAVPDYPLWLVGFICLSFFLAGLVKGFLGMGMPAVLVILLTLFLPPLEAIPLIVLPMLVVNIFQFGRSHEPVAIARRYSVFAVFTILTIFVITSRIETYPEEVLLTSIGLAMVLFALNTFFGVPLRLGPSPLWQVAGGICSGILGGLSTVWSPPVVMYLIGRNADKDEFIGAVGYLFMVGSLGLVLVLGTINLLTVDIAVQSMAGLAISLFSFRIGEYLRNFLDTETFRKAVMIAFLVMGSRLVVVSLF